MMGRPLGSEMGLTRAEDQRAEVKSRARMGSRLTLLSPLPADVPLSWDGSFFPFP